MEKFKRAAEININAVPYKSTAQIYTALLGGEIGITLGALGGAVQFIQRGDVRALASMSAKRPSSLPDLPTVAEAGFEEFNLIPWMGIFVPSGTSAEIIRKLETSIQNAASSPEVRSYLLKGGLGAQMRIVELAGIGFRMGNKLFQNFCRKGCPHQQ